VLDDGIYAIVQRGHSVADVARATAILKRCGLKVHYHWMPGLPGSTPEHDLEMSRELFDNPDYAPTGSSFTRRWWSKALSWNSGLKRGVTSLIRLMS